MNNYDFIEVIGEGTYGVVYKCRDRRDGRIVAVKQFKNFQTNAYIRCTMLRELRVEQLLKGEPNVTQLLETFKQKNRLFLVMEYIPRSLLDVFDEYRSGVPEDSLVLLMYTLLLGIRSCHRNGIIHRDVKPENILVRDDGTASLCDFGFCRPATQQVGSSAVGSSGAQDTTTPNSSAAASPRHHTRTSSAAASAFLSELVLADHRGVMTDYVATRWYRSPEMLLGLPSYDYAVDLWAVGAIMAEAIDGEPLLPGKTELEQLSLVQTRVGEFPAAYEAAVRKRNGGMLHLRSAHSLLKPQQQQPQSHARVQLSCGEESDDGTSATAATTISSYLSMRYGGRIRKVGMHLLSRLLCIDGDLRITVEEALAHPYFDEVRHDARVASASASYAAALGGELSEDDEDEEAAVAGGARRPTQSSVDTLPELAPVLRASLTPATSFVRQEKPLAALGAAASGAEGPRHSAGDGDPLASTASSLNTGAASILSAALPPLPHVAGASAVSLSSDGATAGGINTAPAPAPRASDATDGGPLPGCDSPPPRPVLQGAAGAAAAVLGAEQRRHAASEGAHPVSPDTTALAKSEQRVSTLLFKTRKSRANIHGATGTPRTARDDADGATGSPGTLLGGVAASASFSSRSPQLAMGGAAAAGAPPPRQQPSRDTAAALVPSEFDSSAGCGGASPPHPPTAAVTESDALVFSRSFGRVAADEAEDEAAGEDEAPVSMSAPRGGTADRAGGDGTRRRTSSFSAQRTRQDESVSPRSKAAARAPKPATRPTIRPRHNRSGSAQDDSLAGSVASTPLAKEKTGQEAGVGTPTAAPAKVGKKKRTTSLARGPSSRRTGSTGGAAASATSNLSARTASPAAAAALAAHTAISSSNHTPSARARVPVANARRRPPPATAAAAKVPKPRTAGTAAAAAAKAATASRFASPKLPRVVKPLRPRERMTLLKEIETLGRLAEVPAAVEVLLPMDASPPRGADDSADASDEDGSTSGSSGGSKKSDAASVASSSSAREAVDAVGASQHSQLSVGGDELFVEDGDSDIVSRSPLLSETSERGGSAGRLPTWPARSFGEGATPSSNAAPPAAAHARPPRMDFGYPTHTADDGKSTAGTHSSRAPPSLFFRPSRNAPAPLKLAAIYMGQSAGHPPSSLTGGGPGDGTGASASASSADGTPLLPSNSGLGSGSANAPLQLSPPHLYGRRVTPTLLRHPLPATVTPLASPSAAALEPNAGLRGATAFPPATVPPAPSMSTAAMAAAVAAAAGGTPHDAAALPLAASLAPQRMGSMHMRGAGPHPHPRLEEAGGSDDGPPLGPIHQRRLSAQHLSRSASGELHGSLGAGSAAGLGWRSPEHRLLHVPATLSPLSGPPASVLDIDTEVLANSTTPARQPPWSDRDGGDVHAASTLSPSCSASTAAASSTVTREASALTPPRWLMSRDGASGSRREGSGARASSAAHRPQRTRGSLDRRGLDSLKEAEEEDEDEDLVGGTQTVTFPLPSSGDRCGSRDEVTPLPPRDLSLGLHPPHPILGGVWVNVDPLRNGHGPHTGLGRKKGRLLL